jgi:hypothetical protein
LGLSLRQVSQSDYEEPDSALPSEEREALSSY